MSTTRTHTNPELHGWKMPDDVQQNSPFYRFSRLFCRVTTSMLFKQRVYGRHHEPTHGGVIYLSNHQSFLDPILVTNMLQRPGNYMARDTLFKNPRLSKLISAVNTFPVRRGKADVGAMKEAMRRLRKGHTIVIFPEGTRTIDGHIGPMLAGAGMLSQRAAKWTVPVLIEGAYEAWPRSQKLFRPAQIYVEYGPAISCEEAKQYTPAEFIDRVRNQLIEMQTKLRKRLGKPTLEY